MAKSDKKKSKQDDTPDIAEILERMFRAGQEPERKDPDVRAIRLKGEKAAIAALLLKSMIDEISDGEGEEGGVTIGTNDDDEHVHLQFSSPTKNISLPQGTAMKLAAALVGAVSDKTSKPYKIIPGNPSEDGTSIKP